MLRNPTDFKPNILQAPEADPAGLAAPSAASESAYTPLAQYHVAKQVDSAPQDAAKADVQPARVASTVTEPVHAVVGESETTAVAAAAATLVGGEAVEHGDDPWTSESSCAASMSTAGSAAIPDLADAAVASKADLADEPELPKSWMRKGDQKAAGVKPSPAAESAFANDLQVRWLEIDGYW